MRIDLNTSKKFVRIPQQPMIRILFVSIAFPPKSDPECIQTARYYYGLSLDQDVVVDVVTSKNPTLFMPVDHSLDKYSKIAGQLIEISVYESRYVNFILRKVAPVALSRPDPKMTFHWQWRTAVRKLEKVPDVIYSRSNPLSSAIMALNLSKHYDRPWIMHLSDPWTENALSHYSKKELAYHAEKEKECFEHASMISVTSEKTAILYRRKFPAWAKKIEVFPNVHDWHLASVSTPQKSKQSKVTIVYTGGLANTRTARPLLDALGRMAHSAPHLVNRLQVIFAGEIDRNNRKIFRNFSNPFIQHLGRVATDKASQLQQSADLLVVIDSIVPEPEKAVFFPSKLLDYIKLGKPILAITDAGSVTEDFVVSHGGVCFRHERVEELAEWLQFYLEGNIVFEVAKVDPYYGPELQSARLINTFKEIKK